MKQLIIAIKATMVLTLLTGLIYPLLVTGLAKVLFPHQADGSLIEAERQSDRLGIDRPALHEARILSRPAFRRGQRRLRRPCSGGSNLGPTNQKLIDRVRGDVAKFRAENPGFTGTIPADIVTGSGSGLDPDISPAAADAQAARVASARHMPVDSVRSLIAANSQDRQLGVLGEPRVNVLLLNLALDRSQGLRP